MWREGGEKGSRGGGEETPGLLAEENFYLSKKQQYDTLKKRMGRSKAYFSRPLSGIDLEMSPGVSHILEEECPLLEQHSRQTKQRVWEGRGHAVAPREGGRRERGRLSPSALSPVSSLLLHPSRENTCDALLLEGSVLSEGESRRRQTDFPTPPSSSLFFPGNKRRLRYFAALGFYIVPPPPPPRVP